MTQKFDLIHEIHGACSISPRSVSYDASTTIPIIMNDDAQGDPMDVMAHPEHASWTEQEKPNCFPDSKISGLKITLDIVTSGDLATAANNIIFKYGLIACAFPEDLDAKDELSGLTLKEILELQKETTDRQTYPLWTGTDVLSASAQAADVPGLTTNQTTEGVAFSGEVLKTQRRYGKLKGLIKKCMPIGLRTMKLRWEGTDTTHRRITITFLPSASKFINPHTFLGLLIHVPQAVALWKDQDTSINQPVEYGELSSDADRINFAWTINYFQRNDWHMGKV